MDNFQVVRGSTVPEVVNNQRYVAFATKAISEEVRRYYLIHLTFTLLKWAVLFHIYAFFFFSEQNQTDRVRLVRLSSVIELTKNFNLDCVRSPNQSQSYGTVGVRSSARIDFSFGLVRLTGSSLMIFPDFLPAEPINLVVVVFTVLFSQSNE